ncbi:TolC family protein [uncultured Dokdonia sp.]|uniref:TolC family protein n=1 Tax=unclassified Dokdonia TaxID=2615033 RepID=UPI00260B0107|nr:TolC family protein [uncultured Dokdonia sp.]
MKKAILFCMTALLALTTYSQEKKWTLQECVQYAIDNNINIQQTELDLETAAIDRSDAIGAFLPTLNGTASNSWQTGLTQNVLTGVLETQQTRNSSFGVSSGVRLINGFRNHKVLDRAELSKIAADYNIAKLKDDVALNVAVSYLQVLLARESAKVIVTQNAVTKEQILRTQELVDGGVLPRGDLLEIRATDASERQRIVAAENGVTIGLVNLAQLLNIKDIANFDIAEGEYEVQGEGILDTQADVLIETAKETRYDLKIAEQNEAIAKKDLEISKTGFYPTLDAFFNYNTRESNRSSGFNTSIDPDTPFIDSGNPIGVVGNTGDIVTSLSPNITGVDELGPLPFIEQLYLNDGISYGLSLRVPVFNGFSVKNQVKRSEVNVMRSEFQKELAEQNLRTAVYQAYTDAKAARESYEAAKIAVESQELAYAYAKDRYDVGLTNAFDFSQSKLRYDNAQIEIARSKYDYIFRIKVLELYFGVPVTELKF